MPSIKKWFPLESNPDVMNSYLGSLGVVEPAVQFIDVFCTDATAMGVEPSDVYALLLVYPITAASEKKQQDAAEAMKLLADALAEKHTFFYAEQTVSNACGTMAILHALLNNYERIGTVEKGSVLDAFGASLLSASAEKAGQVIEHSDMLDSAHNDAALDGATENQDIDASIDLHFVTFVKIGDSCVELDGRKACPFVRGACDAETFPAVALAAIQDYMNDNPDSVNFNITALVKKSA